MGIQSFGSTRLQLLRRTRLLVASVNNCQKNVMMLSYFNPYLKSVSAGRNILACSDYCKAISRSAFAVDCQRYMDIVKPKPVSNLSSYTVESQFAKHYSTDRRVEVTERKKFDQQSIMQNLLDEVLSNPSVCNNWRELDKYFREGSDMAKKWPSVFLSFIANLDHKHPELFEVGLSLSKYAYEVSPKSRVANLVSCIAICIQHGGSERYSIAFDFYKELQNSLSGDTLDSTSALLLIRCFSVTSRWKDCLKFLAMAKETRDLNRQYYNPIVIAACKNGDYVLMDSLLQEMHNSSLEPSSSVFICLVDCGLTLELLDYMAKYRWIPAADVAKTISEYFLQDSAAIWNVGVSNVSKSGRCNRCSQSLFHLPELSADEFEELRKSFMHMSVLREGNIFMNTSPVEIERFKSMLNSSTSFDIVIDALNVAFKTYQKASTNEKDNILRHVIEYFAAKNKILILGKKHMTKWRSFKSFNSNNDRITWFLTDNVSEDDTFMIYAALHSGPATKIVTSDELRDHRFLLGTKLANRLKAWQRGHQVMFLGLRHLAGSNVLKFKWPDVHDTRVQQASGSWHIPFDDQQERTSFHLTNSWYCLRRTNS